MKKIILFALAGIVTMPTVVFAFLPDDETPEGDENIRTIFAQGRRGRSPHDVHLGDCYNQVQLVQPGGDSDESQEESGLISTRGTTFYLGKTSDRK